MKKFLSVLLTLMMLLTPALAEETPGEAESSENFPLVQEDVSFPYVSFTSDVDTAISYFTSRWVQSGLTSTAEAAQTPLRLENGADYTVHTLSFQAEAGMRVEARFYAADGKVVAAAQTITPANESQTVELFKAQLQNSFGFGKPEQLALSSIGVFAELLADEHLANGQEMWPYTLRAGIPGTEEAVELKAFLTLHSEEGRICLVEFVDPAYSSDAAPTLLHVKGFDQLTDAEKNAVTLYAEYLEKQKTEQLEQFIDFILNSRK